MHIFGKLKFNLFVAVTMEKTEHLARMLNKRTSGKIYENFIINAIYQKIGNLELMPITQQYVKDPDDSRKYYLIDLYFPQVNYGIEVDEAQHNAEQNIIADHEREQMIKAAIDCTPGRIKVFNSDFSLKPLDEIYRQIDTQVEIIIEKIRNLPTPLEWKDNDDLKADVIGRGYFDISDNVSYINITEIYNLLGHNAKRLGKCFWYLKKPYCLWVPTLAVKLDDGTTIIKAGWENTMNEERTVIYERDKGSTKGDVRYEDELRVVFMKMKDSFGRDCRKFIGVFKWVNTYHDGSDTIYVYERVAQRVNISDLMNDGR